MEFIVLIHEAEEGGCWAEVPALPECFAQGDTLDELIADIRSAIQSHLEALREAGQSATALRTMVATVDVA